MPSTRTRIALASVGALALATQFAVANAHAAVPHAAAMSHAAATHHGGLVRRADSSDYTAAEVLAGIQQNSTAANQVNTEPHINTMTRAVDVNVYQVASGVYAYTSSMAIDDDGSDPDPDPDHQDSTTFQDSNGAQLAAHHVPYYVLGDDCWDNQSPCPHFFYQEHDIAGGQFALIFYQGQVIGAIFGDTQTGNDQTTSNNDSRELGEASTKAASLLGIPDSGTTGGVDGGVTVAIFSGPQWVVNGTNDTLNDNAQGLVQQALNTLGAQMAGNQ
jgi:Fungal chitosanase of glycosyl hydrolase group 75